MSNSKTKSLESAARPLGLRVWHWSSGLILGLILLTVFLRKTFMSSRKMAATLTAELTKSGIQVSEDAAKLAGRAIRDGMWEWHYRLGFVLAGLLVFRFVFGRFPFPKLRSLKGFTHAGFYAVTAFMAVSGLLMYFSEVFHLSESLVDEIQEIHETGQWFFFIFVPMHLIGVVRAELTGERGIVSRMIHGGE